MADWVEVLTEVTKKHWEERGRPLFLAQIPPLLKSLGIDVAAALAGRPLLVAIQFDAAKTLRLVNDPNHAPAWGVLPASAPEDLDVQELFAKSPTSRVVFPLTQKSRKFRRWFWAAFIKPLAADSRRWVLSECFADLPKAEEPTETGAVEILDDEIVHTAPDAIADEIKVVDAIQRWAIRTKTNVDQFRDRLLEREGKPPRQSVATLAFESLDPEDQKRIVVPLDIVMKLLRH